MNKREIEETILRYNSRFEEFGVGEKAVGWGEKGRANLRFEILLSRWNIEDSRVLDFGCGLGFMLDYLRKIKGFKNTHYVGLDINPTFIEYCKETYANADFLCTNLLEESLHADYLFSSGVFNHKLADNKSFIESCFQKFNETAKKGFAINFLSNKVAYEYDYTYHADPAFILDLCYKYSNNVVLRNDYMPFEFTVFVDKQDPITQTHTVYESYEKYL